MPNPLESAQVNVRSPRYCIARATGGCRHCGSPTALVAIALPPGHETLDADDDPCGDDDPRGAGWSTADHNAFLFHIEYLPAAVLGHLGQSSASFRLSGGSAAPAESGSSDPAWMNHCERCGREFDDQELFCEPEGAFLPTSQSAAAGIRLETVDEAFEAFAAGYSFEPPYFNSMSRE